MIASNISDSLDFRLSQGDGAFNVPGDWRPYTNACWAANWHRLFAGDPNDARGRMGWPNRFQGALTNATEVYHCWQKQEVLKGMETLAGTLSGGWGFNVWDFYDELTETCLRVRYSPAGAKSAVESGTITNRPAFSVYGAGEMMDPSATEDDVFLALAKHVPALSSPVGGMAVSLGNRIENHDLNSESEYRNGWGRNHSQFGVSWLHSDMKDMVKLYDKWLEFDLERGDFLPPVGSGVEADMLIRFRLNGRMPDDWSIAMDISFTNHPHAGAYRLKKDVWSDMKSSYRADTNAIYQTVFTFKYCHEKGVYPHADKLEKDEYMVFRTRTRVDRDGNLLSARYGKLYGPWHFEDAGGAQIHKVFMNALDNDVNLEDTWTIEEAKKYR